jgi:PhnB protein
MKIRELFAYLHVKGAAKAIDFYTRAFGAKEKFRLAEPSGRIGHAELDFGGSRLMLADEFPEYNIKGPQAAGATTVTIHLHVDNADEVIRPAAAAKDQFYGERSGRIRDPFGHEWNIGHQIENLSSEEMQRRYTAMMKGK